ncbi:MAG: putative membrane protein SpoIIM required for sporulation [Alteromonadaceae bacterium]|jgi:uncharacterized membrane protein SpoIIM required for sporulation
MKQQTFESLYLQDWQQMEEALLMAEKKALLPWQKNHHNPDLPQLYRRICHHLSLAQERRYSSYLVSKLNNLVLRGHQQLYQRQSHFLQQFIRFIIYSFPHQVRQNQRYIWVAATIFYAPALIIYALVQLQPELVYSVFSPEQVGQFESMYDPNSSHFGQDRAASSDMQMFGYYIQNNISVGFQTFATGIFFALGSIFYLLYNGLVMGAIAAHLVNINYHSTFFPFVIGHGSFELTAIVIAGGAGMMLGHALISPKQQTRLDALKTMAQKALVLLYGVIFMLVIAAFFEAFWSSNSALPSVVKYTVGSGLWLMIGAYFAFAGKHHKAPL